MSAPRAILKEGSKLSKLIANLDAKPKLNLTGVKSLKLSYAYRNDHFGARHFAKEDLPRIRWANPQLDIQVERAQKTAEEQWRPELVVNFADGKSTTLNLQDKFSKAIVRELMDAAGDSSWTTYKAEKAASGEPLFPDEQTIKPKIPGPQAQKLPNLQLFRELSPVPQGASKSSSEVPAAPTPNSTPEKPAEATASS